jgi:hypothetical protein
VKLYRVRNWQKHYENNRTKELIKLTWVPIPNDHDGDGYTLLISHKNGVALFGAWIALIQVASRCDPRGTLLRRHGEPHNSASLSRITRIPTEIFDVMLDVTEHQCKWLESEDLPNPAPDCGNPALDRREVPLNGREWKGMELNRMEGNVCTQKFVPPTIEEARELAVKSGLPEIEGEKFWHNHNSAGWLIKGKPMKSLNSAMATWTINYRSGRFSPKTSTNGTAKPYELKLAIEAKEKQCAELKYRSCSTVATGDMWNDAEDRTKFCILKREIKALNAQIAGSL